MSCRGHRRLCRKPLAWGALRAVLINLRRAHRQFFQGGVDMLGVRALGASRQRVRLPRVRACGTAGERGKRENAQCGCFFVEHAVRIGACAASASLCCRPGRARWRWRIQSAYVRRARRHTSSCRQPGAGHATSSDGGGPGERGGCVEDGLFAFTRPRRPVALAPRRMGARRAFQPSSQEHRGQGRASSGVMGAGDPVRTRISSERASP
ncbi:hypothetical protein AKJ09_08404 [Labilithrix luteola]|uniref:Uncharacterized protein n=1 Tax=Labilithrix luteola TaxID=1391654 RepID=A0A0K1Q7G0_9BACT|nr:hypothetical protein AKJ09_08404 [Labilithrix luteola]